MAGTLRNSPNLILPVTIENKQEEKIDVVSSIPSKENISVNADASQIHKDGAVVTIKDEKQLKKEGSEIFWNNKNSKKDSFEISISSPVAVK